MDHTLISAIGVGLLAGSASIATTLIALRPTIMTARAAIRRVTIDEALARSEEDRKDRQERHDLDKLLDDEIAKRRAAEQRLADTHRICAERGNKCGQAPGEMVVLYQTPVRMRPTPKEKK